jgi:hypothetical protein
MVQKWKQAPENTLESLQHAIRVNDGIEFDLRLTSDQELVLHHDADISVPASKRPHSVKWTENHTLDELTSFGFLSFEEMLADPILRSEWRDKGKMGCIELKRPHPNALYGGGIFGKKQHISHIRNMIVKADVMLDEYDIPHENTVYYAFHNGMKASAELSKTKRPWSNLTPYIPPFGTYYTKRMRGTLHFVTTPLARLIRTNRNAGASMAPCAVEYFLPPQNWITMGRRGSLKGDRIRRVNAHQGGFPIYVWPANLGKEHDILEAGLTGLTDCSDPNMTWLPSGHLRWTRPATLPLDAQQCEVLKSATQSNHQDILNQLHEEVVPWSECDTARKTALVDMWKTKWQWSDSTASILERSSNASPPWEAIRLLGHRGSGKTSRPVLK